MKSILLTIATTLLGATLSANPPLAIDGQGRFQVNGPVNRETAVILPDGMKIVTWVSKSELDTWQFTYFKGSGLFMIKPLAEASPTTIFLICKRDGSPSGEIIRFRLNRCVAIKRSDPEDIPSEVRERVLKSIVPEKIGHVYSGIRQIGLERSA